VHVTRQETSNSNGMAFRYISATANKLDVFCLIKKIISEIKNTAPNFVQSFAQKFQLNIDKLFCRKNNDRRMAHRRSYRTECSSVSWKQFAKYEVLPDRYLKHKVYVRNWVIYTVIYIYVHLTTPRKLQRLCTAQSKVIRRAHKY
jgi:hypothetical protein